MTRRLLTVAAGIGSGATILTVTGALAAYTSPRLEITQVGDRVTISIAQNPGDDATALARIISPLGTRIAEARPAGTPVGTAKAMFVATSGGGGQLPAEGEVVVAASDQVPEATQSACAEEERVEALWIVAFAGEGVRLSMPVYLLTGGDLLVCLPHPSAMEQGAKLISLELVLDGALRVPAVGTWISIWVPYDGNAEADTTRVVASPAVFGPGVVTFSARAKGAGAVVTGLVRQGGVQRANARVTITGGAKVTGHKKLGVATTNAAGRFTFRAKSGTYFRATAAVGRTSPPGICFALEPLLRPIPCVNPTLNGFSVRSKTIKKR